MHSTDRSIAARWQELSGPYHAAASSASSGVSVAAPAPAPATTTKSVAFSSAAAATTTPQSSIRRHEYVDIDGPAVSGPQPISNPMSQPNAAVDDDSGSVATSIYDRATPRDIGAAALAYSKSHSKVC